MMTECLLLSEIFVYIGLALLLCFFSRSQTWAKLGCRVRKTFQCLFHKYNQQCLHCLNNVQSSVSENLKKTLYFFQHNLSLSYFWSAQKQHRRHTAGHNPSYWVPHYQPSLFPIIGKVQWLWMYLYKREADARRLGISKIQILVCAFTQLLYNDLGLLFKFLFICLTYQLVLCHLDTKHWCKVSNKE